MQLSVGAGFHPNSQIGADYAHTEALRGCAPSNPAAREDTPLRVYVLAQGARRKPVDFFPQNLLYVSGDFHTFGPFTEGIVLFQVSGTVYDA